MALCLSTALVLLTLPSLQSPQPSMASGSARTGAALPASLGTGGVSPSASWAYAPFGSHIGTSGLVVSEGLASPQLFLGGGLGPLR